MLGNFSIGDYFKQGAVEFAWEFSLEGFGFDPEQIWVTIFEGDDALGLGPDEEAIEAWLSVGVPRERIVPLGARGQLLAGRPDRPVRAVLASSTSTAGSSSARADELPGSDGERFLEYWNLVFMQYDQEPEGVLTPLPAQNIDTGLGLNRLAAIMQGTTSIFETDQIRPLVTLGEELSGRTYGESEDDRPRAADPRRPHARHVVPRRRRRRAVQRGPRLRAAPADAPRDRAGAADRDRDAASCRASPASCAS